MDTRFSIAIKTANRAPKRNYLLQTLHNLQRSGAFMSPYLVGNLHLVVTDEEDWLGSDLVLPSFVVVHFPQKRRTLHQNAATAIREAAGEKAATHVLVLEDDLDFCADFLGSVSRWLNTVQRGKAMYVLGANYNQVEEAYNRGANSWRYPVRAFYGAQALVWERPVAERLAQWLGPNPSHKGITDHGHDLLLQDWGEGEGADHFLASVPSFVQHIGVESGIGNRTFRFTSWPGPSWAYGR